MNDMLLPKYVPGGQASSTGVPSTQKCPMLQGTGLGTSALPLQ